MLNHSRLASLSFFLLTALTALTALTPGPACAAIQTREVEYAQGGVTLVGFFAWDDAVKTRRPGVVVVHEWWGHNDYARTRARKLAEAGFVGMSLDMYGKGKVAAHPGDAQKFMQEATKDPTVVQARFAAAVDLLKKDPLVDPEHIGAIGYCFGGRIVLEMAQRGADLDFVASFHGAIPPPVEAPQMAVKGRVLIFNGAADPMVPADAIASFLKALTSAKADFIFANLPGAKHSFTNPAADKAGVEGLGYSPTADATSWAMFLASVKVL